MPRTKNELKIDPNGIYQTWQGISLHEPNVTLGKGQRLLGSHPAVQAAPWAFVPDGTADGELPSHWDAVVERTEAAEAALPEHDLSVTALPIPIETEIVEATRPVKLLVGHGGESWTGGPAPAQVVTIEAGTRFNATEPIVTRLPTAFRKV